MKKPLTSKGGQYWELSAQAVLFPLLSPGETLGIAFSGSTGWPDPGLLTDLFIALLGGLVGGQEGNGQYRTTYIGVSDADLVYVISKDPRKPNRLQRVPLGNVAIIQFKERRRPNPNDSLVIDTGTRRLTLLTGANLRPVIHEFIADLDRRKQGSGSSGSSGRTATQPARRRTFQKFPVCLKQFIGRIPRDVSGALRAEGPARASLRACRHSINMLAASLAAGLFLVAGIFALTFIFPGGIPEPYQDILLFILSLPILLTTLVCSLTSLAAGGLAITSIFKKGEKPLTVIAALLGSAALIFINYIIVTLLMTSE